MYIMTSSNIDVMKKIPDVTIIIVLIDDSLTILLFVNGTLGDKCKLDGLGMF